MTEIKSSQIGLSKKNKCIFNDASAKKKIIKKKVRLFKKNYRLGGGMNHGDYSTFLVSSTRLYLQYKSPEICPTASVGFTDYRWQDAPFSWFTKRSAGRCFEQDDGRMKNETQKERRDPSLWTDVTDCAISA